MKSIPNTSPETRYLAIDLHKHYAVFGGVNIGQQVILSPRRVEIDDLENWCRKNLLARCRIFRLPPQRLLACF